MNEISRISRRDFLKIGGIAAGGAIAAELKGVFAAPEPITGPEFTDSPEFNSAFVYRGEAEYNNIRAAFSGEDVFAVQIQRCIGEYANKDAFKHVNRFLETITNTWEEEGLGHNDEDMGHYASTFDILSKKDTMKVNELVRANGDTYTFGFNGAEHDRDASSALAALAVTFAENFSMFFDENGVITIDKAFKNPDILAKIKANQTIILGNVQNRFLSQDPSPEEVLRRSDPNSRDASRLLPVELQKPDDYESCNVFTTKEVTRDKQGKSLRTVKHTTSAKDNFNESNTHDEAKARGHHVAFIGTYSHTKQQERVYAFNDRNYVGEGPNGAIVSNEKDCAVFEQEKACAIAQPAKPTNQPQPTNQPVEQQVQPASTPDNHHDNPNPTPKPGKKNTPSDGDATDGKTNQTNSDGSGATNGDAGGSH